MQLRKTDDLKFRAFSFAMSLTGMMSDGKKLLEFLEYNQDWHGARVRFTNSLIPVYDCEIMQYSGLKDCNGKEIYEGDILRIGEIGTPEKIAPVSFENGCFYTMMNNSKYRLGGWENKALYVIGNIFQTPELINW